MMAPRTRSGKVSKTASKHTPPLRSSTPSSRKSSRPSTRGSTNSPKMPSPNASEWDEVIDLGDNIFDLENDEINVISTNNRVRPSLRTRSIDAAEADQMLDFGNYNFDLENGNINVVTNPPKRPSISFNGARRISEALMQDDRGVFRFATLAGWQAELREEVEALEKDMRALAAAFKKDMLALAAALESTRDGMDRVVAKSKVRFDSMVGDGRVRSYEADIDIVDTREL